MERTRAQFHHQFQHVSMDTNPTCKHNSSAVIQWSHNYRTRNEHRKYIWRNFVRRDTWTVLAFAAPQYALTIPLACFANTNTLRASFEPGNGAVDRMRTLRSYLIEENGFEQQGSVQKLYEVSSYLI